MLADGLVVTHIALTLFDEIEPLLFRYPSIDAPSFRRRVEEAFNEPSGARGGERIH